MAFWERRRPRHLLSGKVYCGVCGRSLAAIGEDYLGCRAAKVGSCSNRARIRRGELEAQVLAAIGSRLMRPELVTGFVAAFNGEWCRLSSELATKTDERRRELASIQRRIVTLVDLISDGSTSSSILARLRDLEAQQARLRAMPDPPHAPPVLHPDVASVYAARVAGLQAALANGEDREALEPHPR